MAEQGMEEPSKAKTQGPVRKWLRRVLILIVVIYFGAFLIGIPPWYTFLPVEGRVFDLETGQPLEGVIVVANWEFESGSLGGGNVPLGRAGLAETVTDKEGRYRFEGFSRLNLKLRAMRDSDPQLLIYKPRYWYVHNYNKTNWGPFRERDFQTFELARNEPNPKLAYQNGMDVWVREVIGYGCSWTRTPRMMLAMHDEKRWLKDHYPSYSDDLLDFAELSERANCSPAAFAKEHHR